MYGEYILVGQSESMEITIKSVLQGKEWSIEEVGD